MQFIHNDIFAANYRVKIPSLDTVCDSGILRVPSADKCSCLIVETKEDVHDRTLHKASLAGHDSLSQDVDPCETADPNTSRDEPTKYTKADKLCTQYSTTSLLLNLQVTFRVTTIQTPQIS